MVRNKNWKKEEILILSEFVKTNRPKLYGKANHCSSRVEKRKEKAWEKAATILASNGFSRSPKQTRKKWSDLKVCANRYEGQKKLTGGGPSINIDPIHEAVLSAIAPQSKEGIASGSEAGFGSSDESECSESEVAVALLRGMTEPAVEIMISSATTPASTSTTPASTSTTPASTSTTPASTSSTPASTSATPASTSTTPAATSTTPPTAQAKKASHRTPSASSSRTPESETASFLATQLEIERERLLVEKEKLLLRREEVFLKKEQMTMMKEMLTILRQLAQSEA